MIISVDSADSRPIYLQIMDEVRRGIAGVSDAPLAWKSALYLGLGCVRGFTLVPATYLLLAGMLMLPPVPLFLLTLAGILVSSTAVYYFAEAMGFAELFERRHAPLDLLRS